MLAWKKYVSSMVMRGQSVSFLRSHVLTATKSTQLLSANNNLVSSTMTRPLGTGKKKNRKVINQQPKKKKKPSKKEEKRLAQDQNFRRERAANLKRMNGLHPAAKWKRILSAADFWFSKTNLQNDSFLRETLYKYHGWLPISVLLTFPKFEHWANPTLLVEAFTSSGAKRYEVTHSRKLCENPQSIQKMIQDHQMYNGDDDDDDDDSFLVSSEDAISADDDDDNDEEKEEIISSSDDEENVEKISMRGSTELHSSHSIKATSTASDDDNDDEQDSFDWGSVPDEDDDILNEVNIPRFDENDHSAATKTKEIHPPNGPVDLTAKGRSFPNLFQLDGVMEDTEEIFKYALVRHKRVNREMLDAIEYNKEEDGEVDGDDDDEEEDVDYKVPKPRKVPQRVKKYATERPVHVVKTPSQLQTFCHKLEASTRRFAKNVGGDPNACAIGMDVEYCTLELDIRSTLPAMIQLSSPDPFGPVGLIWLDKFPDHGRTMLNDPLYGPLIELLADPTLLKVGVGVTSDAKHLSSWWGLTRSDRQHMNNFFGGVTELDDDLDAASGSLADLCYAKLGLKLLKLKDLDGQRNRAKKRKGKRIKTSHWRTNDLTPAMKQYAVNDAACSVDIWKRTNGIQVKGDIYNLKAVVVNEDEFF